MSENTHGTDSGAAYKVLTIRTTEDIRAQLEVLAQLNQRSVTEETRLALERWVEQSKSDPAVRQRAEQVRADIEREAETKRNAIAAVLGTRSADTPPAPRAGKQAPSA